MNKNNKQMTKEDQDLINKFCSLSNRDTMSGYEAAMIEAHAKKCADICAKYAKQQAIAFNKWADENCARNGEDVWLCRCDDYKTNYTSEQIYNQFIEQQNKQ